MSREVLARIDAGAMRDNMDLLQRRAPRSRMLAVLKADAYGHGALAAGRALEADADGFGVAGQGEAQHLRDAGLTRPIVLFGGFDAPADIDLLRQLDVRPVIHHPAQIAMLEARGAAAPISVWFKIDSGMNRLGFPPDEVPEALARLRALPGVAPDIVLMTHFAASDEPDSPTVARQIARFRAATAGLGLPVSLANSTAVLDHPDAHGDWIRPGGALYGLTTKPGRCAADDGLRPAMRLSARLVAVRDKPAGAAIGYGGSFVCPEPMRIGAVAVGYGDGYPRHAPTGTPVLVNGARCRTVGRVSMDLVTVDLAQAPDAKVGDEVVLWGDGLAIEEVAASAGTISYELSCVLTRRVRFAQA
ncbi:MAG: alanine racemase [Chiayiivirga sp.]|jgi:alanine racemase|uniref:Alanine racemase n=1 Tax=Denitratimonas tolerans TaxID=1338420 RepID=A0AAW9R536_9GAMM|nr:alanine racemase [Xanthomonadaceae bacterium]MDX9763377.1 alanine racemase [Chiayiivirga sp.]